MKNPQYIYGIHTVLALLNNKNASIIELLIQQGRDEKRIKEATTIAQRRKITIRSVTKSNLQELTGNQKHQGIAAIINEQLPVDEHNLLQALEKQKEQPFLLILDSVQDPHNLGACLRSAEASGANAVIAPKDCSCSLTPTARKVASGAAEKIPYIQVTNLSRTLKQLKQAGIWIIGAAAEANQSLFETELNGAIAIVLGAEGTGLRRLTKENCDYLSKIPMSGSVSSLNVSVAAGIFLFEAVRQRVSSKQISAS